MAQGRDTLGGQLRHLQTADLIRLAQSEPELEYWFKHAAIQETVYGSLLKATRADLHQRVAEAIERSLPADAGDRAAMLALHFERAGLYAQAFHYAVEAGDRALRTYALPEAIGFYDRALAMAERLKDPKVAHLVHSVYASRGRAFQSQGDHASAMANFQAMLSVASTTGDPRLTADAMNYLTTIQVLIGGLSEEVERHLAEALRLARLAGDPLLIGRALWNLGLAYRFSDTRRSLDFLLQAREITQGKADEQMRELSGYISSDLSTVAAMAGRYREAGYYSSEGLAIFRALDHRPMLADMLGSLGYLAFAEGNPTAAWQFFAEGLAISQSIGNEWTTAYNEILRGWLEIDAGQFEAALDTVQRGITGARTTGFSPFIGMAYTQLATLYFELGQLEHGQAMADEVARISEAQSVPPVWRAMGRSATALAALERGDAEAAWRMILPVLSGTSQENYGFVEASTLTAPSVMRAGLILGHFDEIQRFCDWLLPSLESSGVRRFEGELLYWRGRLHLARRDLPAAVADLVRARDLLGRAAANIVVWRVDEALAEVYEAAGDRGLALEAGKRSLEMVESLAAGIRSPELRGSFLARPEVARVLARRRSAANGRE